MPAAIWSTVVPVLALSCWLVDGYLAGRRQTLRAMELYAERFVEEFERPLLQPHLSHRPIQSRVRFKPGRARFDVLLAPDAGLRYPNLTDYKKNVMYDVVRIEQALSEHAFGEQPSVCTRPLGGRSLPIQSRDERGRWPVRLLLLSTGGGGGNILRSVKALFEQDLAVTENADAERLRAAVATRFLDTNEFSLTDVPPEERLLIGPRIHRPPRRQAQSRRGPGGPGRES